MAGLLSHILISFTAHKKKVLKITGNRIVSPILKNAYKLQYRHLAPNKAIWIDPYVDINGFYRPENEIIFEGQIKGGDWTKITINTRYDDCKSKKVIRERIFKVPRSGTKFKGLIERFEQKKSWRDTALFTEWYLKDLKRVLSVRKCRNLDELEEHYKDRYDNLFEDIKKKGLLPSNESNPDISPLYICIGPKGQILHYSGSHRLFMAMILEIEKIPVKVLRRHKDWQKIRETLLGNKRNRAKSGLSEFIKHPDIIDEIDNN